MSFLQGNTYLKPVQVFDKAGNIIKSDKVIKGEFLFGNLYKYYGEDGEVTWSADQNAFIVPFTEEDTFSLDNKLIECQVRLLLDDGSISGSKVEKRNVYMSKSTTRLSSGGVGTENGELLEVKLLEEVAGNYNNLINKPSINGVTLEGNKTAEELGIVSEESDPTVPQYIKDITQQNIVDWNNKANKTEIPTKVSQLQNDSGYIKKIPDEYITETELNSKAYVNSEMLEDALKDKATTSYVDKKVTELIGTAPEIHDTLGEISKSIQENESIIDTLNNAIVNKADKSDIPTDISQLNNDAGFITLEDIPQQEVDLDNYYTKDETYSKEEVDAMFSGDGENLLKVAPVVTQASDSSVVYDLVDENGVKYCPAIEIGKEYIVKYVVDGVQYEKVSLARDFTILNPEVPSGQAFIMGINIVDGMPITDLSFNDGRGAFMIQGIYAESYSSINVDAIDGGTSVSSVTLVSITDAESSSKYFTKEETKAYVQEQIALAVTDVLNTEV